MHTCQELVRTLSMRVRNWCTPWAYASVPYAHAQHAHQFSHFSNIHFVYPQHACKELMRALSMCVRNWCVRCWAYESGTEHTSQELSIRVRNWAFASGTNLCTELQSLQNMLSINVRKLCVPWAYESGTNAFAQRVRNWCVPWAYASVSYAYAQHKSKKFPNLNGSLQTMLSICIRNWWMRVTN
jgi:hypothetical protein